MGVTYGVALSACEVGSRWTAALVLLKEMSSQLHPDTAAMNLAAGACLTASEWQHALTLVGTMQRSSLEPDGVTRRIMFKAFGMGKLWQGSLFLLEASGRQEKSAGKKK